MKHRDFTRTFHVRSYTGRRLRNPFFSHDQQTRLGKWLLLAGIIVLPTGLFIFFIFAPFFRYNDIRVEGLTTLSAETIKTSATSVLNKHRWFLLPGRNIFIANKKKVTATLQQEFNFAALSWHRDGRTLVITAEERISEIAWISGEQILLIDLYGTAVRETSDEEKAMIIARQQSSAEIPAASGLQPTMPIIVNQHADLITVGSTVIEVEKVAAIMAIDVGARARQLEPVVYTLEESAAAWVTLQTSQYALYFDFNVPVEAAYSMLDAYRGEHTDLSTILYIDLRFGNHLYIKQR